jgi:hypothetical protein
VKNAVISPVAVIAPPTDKVEPSYVRLDSAWIVFASTEVKTLLSPGLLYVVIPALDPVVP